jgi:hypothetical protein
MRAAHLAAKANMILGRNRGESPPVNSTPLFKKKLKEPEVLVFVVT